MARVGHRVLAPMVRRLVFLMAAAGQPIQRQLGRNRSLAAAIPNGLYVEHIPQLRGVTKSEIKIEKGMALAPTSVGLGIDWDFDAIDNKRVKI